MDFAPCILFRDVLHLCKVHKVSMKTRFSHYMYKSIGYFRPQGLQTVTQGQVTNIIDDDQTKPATSRHLVSNEL